MEGFDVECPGRWLDIHDQQLRHEAQTLISLMEQLYGEALVALLCFQSQRRVFDDQVLEQVVESRTDGVRRRQIRREIADAIRHRSTAYDEHELNLRAERQFRLEFWRSGRYPSYSPNAVLLIFARAFVFSLDGFSMSLQKLACLKGIPDEEAIAVKKAREAFQRAVPELKDVRDTAHHLEDRVLGQRYGSRISIQPVEGGAVGAAVEGVVQANILKGSRLGMTTGSGGFGEVDVSADTLRAAQTALASVFLAFSWVGPVRIVPPI